MSQKIPVVLLQSVKGLGNKDDIAHVAIAYAKNVLFAQGKAKLADKQAIDSMQQKKEKIAKHEHEADAAFQQLAQRKDAGGAVKIQKKSTPQGHLYEKVSAKDIVTALRELNLGIAFEANWIVLKEKIEQIGETSFDIVYKNKKLSVPLSVS